VVEEEKGIVGQFVSKHRVLAIGSRREARRGREKGTYSSEVQELLTG
jgi:hypothetical protein